jgi:hypothetical protein
MVACAGVLNFFRLVYIYHMYTAAYSVDFFTSAGAVKWGGWAGLFAERNENRV